ncbi:hypothetical protein RND81_02G247600 [Saponaria officinalis]|uniref:SBP-type domain-containing protein n=1 Tax=Saponaria officinalis TaxID=3572 RepID=A0AAW1MU41_SAPOF
MSVISMMELNAKSPVMWDLESLVMFSTKVGETPKTLQLVNTEIEGIEGFEVGSFLSSGGHSDHSSWRSSKSASDDSSTNKEIKPTDFSLETNDCFQDDLITTREFAKSEPKATSPTAESSGTYGESLTALELCNRTYFEDISGIRNVKNTAQTSRPRDASAKKLKSSSLSLEIPQCQVEGCNVDLSAAKHYHRKHRVCESHSKSSRVVVHGHERRFCQQCSRFHGLSEFDQKKRSCRRRLSDHNARRRKPKPEIIQFNSMGLASSLFDGRNQLNFGSNHAPVLQTRNSTWDNTSDFKVTNEVYPVSDHFLPSKGTPHEVYHAGIPTSVAPSNMESAQKPGALSLLSIGSWSSCDPDPSPLIHHTMHPNNPGPSSHPLHHGGLPTSSDFWTATTGLGSHKDKPSFQLFKAPDESSFYLY